MSRFQISESVQINRPAEVVFQCISDVMQSHSWRANVSTRDFSGEPLAVGTTWSDVTKFMGREIVVSNEVTAVEPGRGYRNSVDGGVVSGSNTWKISPDTEDSCTVSLSFDGELSGWMASLASGLLRGQAEKNMKKDLGNLKAHLELN